MGEKAELVVALWTGTNPPATAATATTAADLTVMVALKTRRRPVHRTTVPPWGATCV